jgi:dolichol-phosphate mannosyltransferase/undecaprenyl-phosphate 4-deoxy-4-formamido-L-arabinose transferase
MSTRLVSVVVPVFNSTVLHDLADGIAASLQGAGERYEILFVDDGSTDARVWPTLEQLATRPEVRAIQLTRNFGQQSATLCGLREARGSVVVTMDDDLQHDPADLPRLLAHPEADIVLAQLLGTRQSAFRRGASSVKGLFDRWLIGRPKGIHLSSYRVLSRAVVDGMSAVRTPNPFLPALMFHVSRTVVGVPVEHHARREGRSGYGARKLLRLFGTLFASSPTAALRLVGSTGAFFAAVSFILTAVIVYRRLAHLIAVPGWASLIAAQMLIGGLLLLGVGAIGEYLIRTVETAEGRPTYFVRRRSGGSGDDERCA